MRKVIKDNAEAKDFYDPKENYLGFVDFALSGITEKVFIIKSIQVDDIPSAGTGRTEKKPVAILEGAKKVLILSAGKRNALIRLFGELKNWRGKQIKLVADPSVKYKGKITGGLVIKGVDEK